MDRINGPDHIEDVLVKLHPGQWFGWSDSKDKIYANLVIHDDQYETPTQESLEDELAAMQAEYPWNVIRQKRNQLLRDSDWTAVTDRALSAGEQADWGEYRQGLRDIPQTYDDAEDVEWPEAPDV